jgi:hypothetical protein
MDDPLMRQYDQLFALLEGWARWQGGYRMRLGFPARSIGLCSNASKDWQDVADSIDHTTMKTIDAVIQDDGVLTHAERAAVLRRYGVAAVFRFPRDNYADLLVSAHQKLLDILPRKGVEIIAPTVGVQS